MKKRIGDIWKEDYVWKVKFPKGIWTAKTKKAAEKIVEVFMLKEAYDYISFKLPKEGKIRRGYFCKKAGKIIKEIYGIKIRTLCGSFSIEDILEMRKTIRAEEQASVYNELPAWAKGFESNPEHFKRINNL